MALRIRAVSRAMPARWRSRVRLIGGFVLFHLLQGQAPLGGGIATGSGIQLGAALGVIKVTARMVSGAQGFFPVPDFLSFIKGRPEVFLNIVL